MGADVDAARRLVEDEEARLGREPAGEDRLLLVAAGQEADRLFDVGGADVERFTKRSAMRTCSRIDRASPSRDAPGGRG